MPAPAPDRPVITGLVLAGGRGQRMGGIDKGLQPYHGRPLIDHALARLAPQVGETLVSANRHAADYARRGVRVLADDTPDFPGPLAGILAGLRAARTPWLAVVPCDVPRLPLDLVARLARAIAADGEASDEAKGAHGQGVAGAVVERDLGAAGPRLEPVCCLLSTALADDLARALAAGERKVERWIARHARPVRFDRPEDAAAFANYNTLAELDD